MEALRNVVEQAGQVEGAFEFEMEVLSDLHGSRLLD